MSVASKNLFDLLGNDDGDSDNTSGPVKTVDKASTRTAKRNTDGAAPATKTAAAPVRRGGFSGSEAAFRDRGAGADRNRAKSIDENTRGGARGGSGARGRGGRGARYPRDRDDRHNKGLPSGSEKQAAQSWGGNEGDAEMKDEQAGEDIAKKDEKEAATEDAAGADGDAEAAEPEDKSISYDAYLAQIAEKKMALGAEALSLRKANEGSKLNKQWASAKPLVKDDDDEFISGTSGKSKRERERKTKQLVEIDNRFVEERGAAGGGRGRGGPRPVRGRGGGPRPADAPRGGGGGGPGRGRGGSGRGGGAGPHIPVEDPNVFPELGR